MSAVISENEVQNVTAQPSKDWVTLQRVILPNDRQMDTLPLYMDSGAASGSQSVVRNTWSPSEERGEGGVDAGSGAHTARTDDVKSRESARVRPGERISFGTYFNAFAASYWRRWTNVEDVRLRVSTSGEGAVSVYKSNARGSLQHVNTIRVSGKADSTFDLSLKPFGDGGWYWFDVAANSSPVEFTGAVWQTKAARPRNGSVTLGITTLNKVEFCVNNLNILARNPEVMGNIKEILVVDQGTDKVSKNPEIPQIRKILGDKLRIIDQDNLGGSGGFARGMYEAVENDSDYVLLLDDDIVMEPESVQRLVTFADYCKKPTLVGGHMFDLYDRNVLHTFGEIVDPYVVGPVVPHPDQQMRHDFARKNLRETPWLHRRVDVDYNGWWMCLIPTEVIREIGLSLPLFIKWDDAEYGVRAKAAGYNTVSLPGSAVWHVSWIDKDDLVGWQAYFHTRNRFIYALLHSPYERGGGIVENGLKLNLKHLISMQYYTGRGRIEALRDLLGGPEDLRPALASKLPEIRQMAEQYQDAQFESGIDNFPPIKPGRPPRRGKGFAAPSYVSLAPWLARNIVRQLGKPVEDSTRENPQAFIPHQDNKWWRVSQFDSVVVSNAEGTGASWYQRDPKLARKMLLESARLHAEVLRNWPRLREQYRRAFPELVSMDAWKKTFEAHSGKSREG